MINKIVFLYSCNKDLEMEIVGNISLATVIHMNKPKGNNVKIWQKFDKKNTRLI